MEGKQVRSETLFFLALLVKSLEKKNTVKMNKWDGKNSEMCRKTKISNTNTEQSHKAALIAHAETISHRVL